MPTQTGSIDLASQKAAHDAAAQVATNYVTDLTNGAFVHPEGDTSNGVQITNKVEIIRGGDSVAEYGDTVRIGETGNSRIEMDFNSLEMKDKDNNVYFSVSDLRGSNGYADITVYFTGNGSETWFPLWLPANPVSSVSVSVSDSSGGAVTIDPDGGDIEFTTPPTNGATITVTYRTDSSEAKSYTFGSRANGSFVGASSFTAGIDCEASGYNSFAFGRDARATERGAFAFGDDVTAGDSAYAFGFGTIARTGQFVIGEFNDPTAASAQNAAFIVGQGSADDERGNAATIDWDGTIRCGDVAIRGTYISDMFVTETHTASTGSMSAGSTKWVTVNCAKTGYRMLGAVGYYVNGSTQMTVYAMRGSSATEIQFALRNTTSSAQSATLEVTALYVRTIDHS